MQLIRHAHASVTLRDGDRTLVIDPGTFEADAAGLVAEASAVLVTHEHFDHLDVEVVRQALAERPDLVVYGPAGVAADLGVADGRVVVLEDGMRTQIAGFDVEVFGGEHAQVHEEVAVPYNLGYLIEGAVFHPGDSYLVPPRPVETLLVPASGPWVRTSASIDWIREVGPRRTVPIHDAMLSEIGRRSTAMFLGEGGLTKTPMLEPATGEPVTL